MKGEGELILTNEAKVLKSTRDLSHYFFILLLQKTVIVRQSFLYEVFPGKLRQNECLKIQDFFPQITIKPELTTTSE